jgi:hypothetical protein
MKAIQEICACEKNKKRQVNQIMRSINRGGTKSYVYIAKERYLKIAAYFTMLKVVNYVQV